MGTLALLGAGMGLMGSGGMLAAPALAGAAGAGAAGLGAVGAGAPGMLSAMGPGLAGTATVAGMGPGIAAGMSGAAGAAGAGAMGGSMMGSMNNALYSAAQMQNLFGGPQQQRPQGQVGRAPGVGGGQAGSQMSQIMQGAHPMPPQYNSRQSFTTPGMLTHAGHLGGVV